MENINPELIDKGDYNLKLSIATLYEAGKLIDWEASYQSETHDKDDESLFCIKDIFFYNARTQQNIRIVYKVFTNLNQETNPQVIEVIESVNYISQ